MAQVLLPGQPISSRRTLFQPPVVAPASYADEVLADSPVWYCRMGGAASPLQDETANNNDLAISGATLEATGLLVGDADKAASFDGVDDLGTVTHHASLNVGDTFTLEAWIKRGATGAVAHSIFDKGGGGYYFYINFSDELQLNHSETAEIVKSNITIADTNTHHVVATKNGATVKLWIDSVDRTGSVTNSTVGNTAQNLVVSKRQSSAQPFHGTLDELAIYPTALSSARVAAHYSAGT